jgi:hypothetical protein
MAPDLKSIVDQIQTQISELQKQLDEIQAECNHPRENMIIKNINPTGASVVRKICGKCGAHVGFPSSSELDEWIN